jgi:hypothetical protein
LPPSKLIRVNRPGRRTNSEGDEIIVRGFLEKLGLDIGTLPGHEPPDRILIKDGKNISIEVMGLTDKIIRENSASLDRECYTAEKYFKDQYGESPRVLVTFQDNLYQNKRIQNLNIAETLLEEVKSRYIQFKAVQTCNWGYITPSHNTMIQKIFYDFSIDEIGWQSLSAFQVSRINEEFLISCIRKKEDDLHRYEGKFNEGWLVLWCGQGLRWNSYNLDSIKTNIHSKFTRVFIYEHLSKVIELNIRPDSERT